MAKVKVTITLDDKLFEGFKRVLPDYISISGFLDSVIREYMAGYYKRDWSVPDMFDVLQGKRTVSYLQRIHDMGLDELPQDFIDNVLAQDEQEEQLLEELAIDQVEREYAMNYLPNVTKGELTKSTSVSEPEKALSKGLKKATVKKKKGAKHG